MTNQLLQRLRGERLDGYPVEVTMRAAAEEIEQLRGNLSLAEEGLANAVQENERLKAENEQFRQWRQSLAGHSCASGAMAQTRQEGISGALVPHEPSSTTESPYRVRSFWSPDRKHLINVCCSQDDLTVLDDNANIWEPTGPEQDMTKDSSK